MLRLHGVADISLDSHFDEPEEKTPVSVDPCPHCGRTAVKIALVCPPPPTQDIFSFTKDPLRIWKTVFKEKCVIAANWAWCPRARGGLLEVWVDIDGNL